MTSSLKIPDNDLSYHSILADHKSRPSGEESQDCRIAKPARFCSAFQPKGFHEE
jgi:hypothetical protein